MPVRIRILIQDDQMIEDFKTHVKSRYPGVRSFFSYEVEVALFQYLAMNGVGDYPQRWNELYGDRGSSIETAAHTHKIQNADKVLIQAIYERLHPGEEVPYKVLCTWMRRDCGLKDPRTHRVHVDTLTDIGVLHSRGYDDYVIYEVMERPDRLQPEVIDDYGAEVVEW